MPQQGHEGGMGAKVRGKVNDVSLPEGMAASKTSVYLVEACGLALVPCL